LYQRPIKREVVINVNGKTVFSTGCKTKMGIGDQRFGLFTAHNVNMENRML
jgi:hypothetical protein